MKFNIRRWQTIFEERYACRVTAIGAFNGQLWHARAGGAVVRPQVLEANERVAVITCTATAVRFESAATRAHGSSRCFSASALPSLAEA